MKSFNWLYGLALTGLIAWAATAPAGVFPARAAVAQALPLTPHRAVYDLSLAQSRKMSLLGARGRIVYDFTGGACEGYTTNVRQVSELQSEERPSYLSDLRSSTWEDDAGKSFQFNSSNYINEHLATSVDGRAERGADGITVTLKQPVKKTFHLSADTVFPTEQLRRVIAAARAGKTLLELPVYDGSDNGQKIYNTLTVIGAAIAPSVKPDDAAGHETALAQVTRWPVHVSYFDKEAVGEPTPAYTIAFELYENGVSRALKLDYTDFVIAGAMSAIEIKRPPACK